MKPETSSQPFPYVESAQNALVKKARQLHSTKGRKEENALLVEGSKALQEAISANLSIEAAFLLENAPFQQSWSAIAPEKWHCVSRRAMQALSTTETAPPVAAICRQKAPLALQDWLNSPDRANPTSNEKASLLLVIDGLQDPGNMGTLIRSALAFGAQGVLLLPGTVDVSAPKVIRSSAGLSLRLPLLIESGLETADTLALLEEAGFTIWLASGKPGQNSAKPTSDSSNGLYSGRHALVLGQEGQGLRLPESAYLLYNHVSVPMQAAVDSLNVAVCGSILLADWAQLREGKVSHYWG